jgi:ABC-type tungstate transport system substrate-binding protein
MTRVNPRLMVGIAFIMLLLGVALPLMMVMHIIPSTFFLNLMAYLCSFFGIIIGFIGTLLLSKQNPR